jgi:DNA repair photolyase
MRPPVPLPIHGRGVASNPTNRFERLDVVPEPDAEPSRDPDDEPAAPETVYLRDTSRSIIAHNDSPDVGFEYSINPYRGCSHGCVYCYARPTHEYLSFSAGLDFETKILVKADAPALLRKALSSPKYEPVTLSLSGVTDCYQPAERQFKLTRRCIEVLAECGNPLTCITKSHLITRDVDLLSDMARRQLAAAFVSITSLDADLSSRMEPRAASPRRRLMAVKALADAGVPVGVMVAPVVPGLTDQEIPQILKAAAEHGARFAGYVPLRLPFVVKDLFAEWLEQHYPDRRDKVLNRVRAMRDGKLNDSNFGTRMRGSGPFADQVKAMFDLGCRRHGLNETDLHLSKGRFRRPKSDEELRQPSLFD